MRCEVRPSTPLRAAGGARAPVHSATHAKPPGCPYRGAGPDPPECRGSPGGVCPGRAAGGRGGRGRRRAAAPGPVQQPASPDGGLCNSRCRFPWDQHQLLCLCPGLAKWNACTDTPHLLLKSSTNAHAPFSQNRSPARVSGAPAAGAAEAPFTARSHCLNRHAAAAAALRPPAAEERGGRGRLRCGCLAGTAMGGVVGSPDPLEASFCRAPASSRVPPETQNLDTLPLYANPSRRPHPGLPQPAAAPTAPPLGAAWSAAAAAAAAALRAGLPAERAAAPRWAAGPPPSLPPTHLQCPIPSRCWQPCRGRSAFGALTAFAGSCGTRLAARRGRSQRRWSS